MQSSCNMCQIRKRDQAPHCLQSEGRLHLQQHVYLTFLKTLRKKAHNQQTAVLCSCVVLMHVCHFKPVCYYVITAESCSEKKEALKLPSD